MTLYLHARDAQVSRPILGDPFAADLLRRVDHDPAGMKHLNGNLPVICTRARLIDDITRRLLDRRPDAVVLHLGCGLDSRVLRLAPGPGVTWIDVDQEPVIALRRRLYPERAGVTTIAASVTEPGWWARVPDGRPSLSSPRACSRTWRRTVCAPLSPRRSTTRAVAHRRRRHRRTVGGPARGTAPDDADRRSDVPVDHARPVRRRRVLPRTRAPRRDLPDLGRGSAHPGHDVSGHPARRHRSGRPPGDGPAHLRPA